MTHTKQIGAIGLFFLFSIQAGSTPIATVEITNNLPTAAATFDFNGSGNVTQTADDPSSYVRLEAEGFDVVELFGGQIVSNAIPGASAVAELNKGLIRNNAQATPSPSQHYANSTSMTSMDLMYNVENVNSIALSLDMTASMNLFTEANQAAYGSVEEYLALYWFDGTSRIRLTDNDFFLEKEADDGASFTLNNEVHTLDLSYDFGSNPFSGQLVVRGIARSFTDAEASTASVPEPMMLSLLALGMGILISIKRFANPAKPDKLL
jgi:hypothetical protein